jgi:hypothetical protein
VSTVQNCPSLQLPGLNTALQSPVAGSQTPVLHWSLRRLQSLSGNEHVPFFSSLQVSMVQRLLSLQPQEIVPPH